MILNSVARVSCQMEKVPRKASQMKCKSKQDPREIVVSRVRAFFFFHVASGQNMGCDFLCLADSQRASLRHI